MKKIVGYLKDFHSHEFRWGLYVFIAIFLGICVVLNFSLNIEHGFVDAYRRKWIQIPIYFLWYGVPYFMVLMAWAYFSDTWDFLKSPGFWVLSLGGILVLSVDGWFYQYREIAVKLVDPPARIYVIKVLWNMKRYLTFLPILYLFYKWINKEEKTFYGLTRKGFEAKPYFLMLLIVLPGVIAFSFSPDFLKAYPSYKPGSAEAHWGVSPLATLIPYEIAYGLDFATIEHFFRGFLVLGLAKYLGRGAIFPMVAVYCFLHFGKPAGEAVSSIFGGYILGIAALYSRSIWGGVIAHVGLAWMMDFTSILQHYFRGDFG